MLGADGFFQRFEAEDTAALGVAVAADRVALAGGLTAEERAVVLCRVGGSLTVLRREGEAEAFLGEALVLARSLGDRAKEVEVLNNLATSAQYLGRREAALGLFAEALAKAPGCDAWRFRDFVLHHRGRCLVELGRVEAARADFEAALSVRLERGDARYVASTRRALGALESGVRSDGG